MKKIKKKQEARKTKISKQKIRLFSTQRKFWIFPRQQQQHLTTKILYVQNIYCIKTYWVLVILVQYFVLPLRLFALELITNDLIEIINRIILTIQWLWLSMIHFRRDKGKMQKKKRSFSHSTNIILSGVKIWMFH